MKKLISPPRAYAVAMRSWLMLPVGALLIASLAACGVKNDLVRPNGQPTAENERDPSRPPNQTGR